MGILVERTVHSEKLMIRAQFSGNCKFRLRERATGAEMVAIEVGCGSDCGGSN